MHFKALPVGHQNRQISSDFLLSFKGDTYFWWKNTNFSSQMLYRSVHLWKITYFHQMNRFQWFQWIFKREPYNVCSFFTENCLFSRDNLLDINQISKELYRSVSLHEKLSIFIKSLDFKEITEITDFGQFSRDSLPPLGVLIWKIMDFKEIG